MHFTVLMPVYKFENPIYFEQALSSIFTNSCYPSEVVIVCDGPLTDDLNNVLEKFSHIEILKLIRFEKNKGIVAALNFGLRHSTFDIVVRCDSDDINAPDRFESLISCFSCGHDVIGSHINEIDSIGNFIGTKKVPIKNEDIIKFSRYRNPINHMSVAFKRDLVIKYGGYPDLPFKEDYGLWIKLIANRASFYNIPVPLVSARVNEKFYARRKQFRSIMSEFQLFWFRYRLDQSGLFLDLFYCVIRVLTLMLPLKIFSLVYLRWFRDSA